MNEEPSITFDIPFEVKPEDNEYMQDKTNECNTFFKAQGGFVHSGLSSSYSEQISVISQNRSAVQKSFFTHDEQTIYHLPNHWKKFNNILKNLQPKIQEYRKNTSRLEEINKEIKELAPEKEKYLKAKGKKFKGKQLTSSEEEDFIIGSNAAEQIDKLKAEKAALKKKKK